jgi:fatty-acyl-CoA synthase
MDPLLSSIDAPARWARYTPEAPAMAGCNESWSWADLDRLSDGFASRLHQFHGVGPGDRVALLARNHPAFFPLLFGCLRIGAVLAPLNWRLAIPELSAVVALAKPKLLLADAIEHERAVEIRSECPVSRIPARPAPCACPSTPAGDEGPGLLLFTSGTTGLPKAAILPVRQMFFNAVNTILAFRLTGADRTLVFTPLFHTGAIHVLALPLLLCGGTVHVQESFSGPKVVEALKDQGVSVMFGVPVLFRILCETPGFWDAARRLRLCLCGGAPLPVSLIRVYQEHGVILTQGFGMTEAGPNCFFLPPDEALARPGSVGRPMPYARARIDCGGREAGPGEVGELCLAGPHVFAGYLDNPGATAAVLEAGWLRTGDLAARDADGWYRIAGRAKDMFISGGENVYPAEIEVALSTHPEVVEAAVVAVPDERWGEVGRAFVAMARDARFDSDGLVTFLRGRLAGYKIPKSILQVEALPRNATGKVDKAALTRGEVAHAS